MKNLKLLAIWSILFISATSAWSQFQPWSRFRLDIIAGASPGSSPNTEGVIVNRQQPREEFVLNMYKVKPQFYIGVGSHYRMNTSFFLEAGALYTQTTSMFDAAYTFSPSPLGSDNSHAKNTSMTETEYQLLIPASIGVSLGSFEVATGFNAITTLSKKSELTQLKGYESDSPSLRWGWHTGVRYTLSKTIVGTPRTMIGIEYQGSFNRVCQGTSVKGQSLELMNLPGNFVFSLHQRF